MSEETNPDLESFRNQWREEVFKRQALPTRPGGNAQTSHSGGPSKAPNSTAKSPALRDSKDAARDDDYASRTYDFDDLEAKEEARKLGTSSSGVHPEASSSVEPISALDHYEKAVERESQGQLGESLNLYRKAFRLDDCVDQTYKNKHFPPSSFKSQAAVQRPSTNSLTAIPVPTSPSFPQISSLVSSFAESPILNALPIISGDIPPPCLIRTLPNELLAEVLQWIAHTDVAGLSRLAQSCKRFAYLVATEDGLWKRILHMPRYGLGAMHFSYACTVAGKRFATDDSFPNGLPDSVLYSLSNSLSSLTLSISPPHLSQGVLPLTLPLNSTYPTYRHMFHHRPRIRFQGVFISVNNYVRPGAAGVNQITWNTPVHIVTYYRYFRFYRDGTCISLCTTTEPLDVVPHMNLEHVGSEFVATTTMPIGVMRHARRGRWKLAPPKEIFEFQRLQQQERELQEASLAPETAKSSLTSSTPAPAKDSPNSNPTIEGPSHDPDPQQPEEPEGTLTIETEGPTAAYTYHMKLCLRSAGNATSMGPKNTKLAWRGFWSHNRITDDWAEFGLKNDRAFVWARVRSWAES